MRKDSILQQYYYKKLPKYQDKGQVTNQYGIPSARELAQQNMGYSSDAIMMAKQQADARAAELSKKQEQVRPGTNRSAASKAWAIATNPITALTYKVKGQDIPENFERGKLNPYEHAFGMINPFAILNSAGSIPGNIARGEWEEAGLNALNVAPWLAELRGLRGFRGGRPSGPVSSEPVITRGPIDYTKEPGFAARNPNFSHEAYVKNINKFGKTTEDIPDELMPYIENEKINSYKKSLPNKSIIRDDELLGSMPENKYNELINKTRAQAKTNIDRLENIGKDIEAGESWKYTPEEIKKFKVQKELSDEMRIGSDYHPEVSINLQNVNPNKILFENLPQKELKNFETTPFGAQWKSGQFGTYSKADLAKFKTFDEFLANQKLLQGKNFEGQFAPYKMSAFDLIKLNKNKEGGIINDNRGQWAHPGKNTRIKSSNITMQGVNYPVYAKASNGQQVMMQPGQDYYFPGADYVDEYPMMQRGGVPQSTLWQPLTPEIARGRYSGDIEGMVYRETGDPNNPYNITVGDIPEPKQEPKLTYRKPQKIETQRLTPSLQLLNRPNSRIDIPLPERGKYAVEYYDPNEPGGVQGGWHSEKFRTPSEADAFMEQRNKEGKFQGSSMQRRMLEYGGPLVEYYKGKMTGPNMFQDGGGLKPYEGYSIVDFLATQNKPYSYKSRKELAQQAGIKNYRGRDYQNINLINLIKQNPSLIGYNQPTTQEERFLEPASALQIPRPSYTAPIPSSLSIPSASAYTPQYSEIIPRPPVEEEQKVLGRPAPLQLEKSSYIAPGFPSSFTRSYTPQYDKPIPAPSFEEEMPVLKGVGSLSPIESLRPSTAVTMPSYISPGIQGRPNYTNIPLPPAPAKKVTPVKTSKAIASNVSDSMDNILAKQAYKESTWRPGVINKKGYKGLAQLGEAAIQDYKRLTGDTDVDPLNPAHAVKVQRFLMNQLYNSSFINKPNQSEQVRKAKALAAYNWGRGSLSGYLNKMKKRGVDIYNSLDWMKNLPGETIDYINKILLNTSPQFDADYKKAVSNPGNEQIRKLYNVNYKKGGQSNEGYYNYNYNVPEFDYGGYLPKAQNGRISDAANTSSKNRKCGITAANDKEYKECLKEERKEDKVFYKQVAAEEDAMLKQKAQEWADYTNTGLDAYGTKYGKKDKTFQEAFNTFVTANPTFSQQQTTSGLTPEQQYAMFYKMAGRSGSPTYQATGRLKTYMGVDPTQRFTDKQLYEAVKKMGGLDKYIDWYKTGWPEIPKQSYGGDISIPQLPHLQGPLLQYYYLKGGKR